MSRRRTSSACLLYEDRQIGGQLGGPDENFRDLQHCLLALGRRPAGTGRPRTRTRGTGSRQQFGMRRFVQLQTLRERGDCPTMRTQATPPLHITYRAPRYTRRFRQLFKSQTPAVPQLTQHPPEPRAAPAFHHTPLSVRPTILVDIHTQLNTGSGRTAAGMTGASRHPGPHLMIASVAATPLRQRPTPPHAKVAALTRTDAHGGCATRTAPATHRLCAHAPARSTAAFPEVPGRADQGKQRVPLASNAESN